MYVLFGSPLYKWHFQSATEYSRQSVNAIKWRSRRMSSKNVRGTHSLTRLTEQKDYSWPICRKPLRLHLPGGCHLFRAKRQKKNGWRMVSGAHGALLSKAAETVRHLEIDIASLLSGLMRYWYLSLRCPDSFSFSLRRQWKARRCQRETVAFQSRLVPLSARLLAVFLRDNL